MVDNDEPWWEKEGDDDSSSSPKSSNRVNLFTGNVGGISGSSSPLSITPVDPNKFIWSQFFIGLFLIPIFAGVIMGLTTSVADAGNDTYYSDYHHSFSDSGSILISGDEYNTWDVIFKVPEVDLYDIDKNDYWFSTEFSVDNGEWGNCFFDMDMIHDIQVKEEDGSFWYPMHCDGGLRDNTAFFHINGQTFTYATDYESSPSYASVYGDTDISLDMILLSFIPLLLPIFYILIIIWSFIKKKKSLGMGLIGGIIVAPVSFCFSIIFFSVFFYENGW
jgi:hypothetical protein|tara:strand:- start:776 stop:1603 length:828 start_codon:yes stop_codon:yes gene_type:complete